MDGGGSKRTMRGGGGKAAPSTRCPLVLFGFCFALFALLAMPAEAATAAMVAEGLDARLLLMLGINLGIIAFAVGSAIACLRATRAARAARQLAGRETEALRASEATLQRLLAAEPQTLLMFDGPRGAPRLLAASLPLALGVPRETRAFLQFAEWLENDSAAALEQGLRALAHKGEPFNLTLRTRRQRHVEAEGRAAAGSLAVKLRELTGERLEYASLAHKHKELDREIAGLRSLLEAQTRASGPREEPNAKPETRFRSFDRLATAFAVFDAEQQLRHFNQAYVDLWQLDPDWLSTQPRDSEILDRLRQARRLPEKADYREWKRGWLANYGSDAQVETEWHLPDGRSLHVIADSAAEGGVTYLYENVTEQIALESRYNALIDVQRETLDTLREGVAAFGLDGRLRLYNRAFAAIWRLSPQRLDASPHIDEIIAWCSVLYDDPEEWERARAVITGISPERDAFDTQFDRADGSVITSAVLPLPDGGTLLTYVDISDSKRAERALIERNEALEAADRLKTTFIGHISYELRTPLTNIIGFGELLASPFTGELNNKQREYLNDITTSGRTLLAIIDDILDLATIDAGTFELKLSPVRVRDVVSAATQGVRERLQQNAVRLEVKIDNGIEQFVADERRVAQILYNLLSNAIGFSPVGEKIVLTCRRDHDMLLFSVEDRGVGIPADYQESVFDRFESRPHGSAHRGAGLGLSIVKSLVELHGGGIRLDSEPGRGTKVIVSLPFDQRRRFSEEAEFESYRASRAG